MPGTEIQVAAVADADLTVSSRVLERIAASVPDSTRRAYTTDWKAFEKWCREAGRTALPCTAETLAEYVSHLADKGRAPAGISRAISSIRVAHDLSGHQPPRTAAARSVIKAYRNERADAGIANETPLPAMTVRQVKILAEAVDVTTAAGLRDRLIIVLGWAMMARRGELARLNIADVTEVESGLDVLVRKAKADQLAVGRKVAVPYGSDPVTCPVRLMRSWTGLLSQRGITSGPLLRRIDRWGNIAGEPGTACAGANPELVRMSGEAVRLIVVRTAKAAKLETHLSAHSLRAGGATGAYLGDADLLSIGRHGGWRDGSPVLMRYIRDVDRWKKNPMHGAGL